MPAFAIARQFTKDSFTKQVLPRTRSRQFMGRMTHNLLFRTAILMSFLGVGLSTFSISQLHDTRPRHLFLRDMSPPQQWHNAPVKTEELH
ncbi:hypothetical protein NP493_487g02000 [Ridgeia piscesae]|uniref:Uncharacterized protein n=1 Tax=Ridgeia piscesae TaxID=27915 RepID=A0AAD9KY57_RIDPI|nr:hypothetical protein NP493_487g02000 [Ridgeia piscesae]